MGGGNSQPTPFMSHMVMPLYFIENASLSDLETAQVQESWQLILDDKCSGYVAAKNDNHTLESQTCIVYFYDSFYKRLFDVHPSSRELFECNMIAMGKMLVAMLTAAVKLLTDLPSLVPKLQHLAEVHSKKGVLSYQYGIVGEVLLWTLTKCLGPEYFANVATAWVKVYSIILSVMVPVALKEESVIFHNSKSAKAEPTTTATTNATTTTSTTTSSNTTTGTEANASDATTISNANKYTESN